MTTVVVVTYNSARWMRACLSALGDLPTIVVDNASRDDTLGVVRAQFPDVTVDARSSNGGYAVAVNEASALVPDDDILLLNPDVVVRPGSITALEEHMAANPRAGIVVPRLLYPDGSVQESVRRFPSPVAMLARRLPIFGHSWIGRRVLDRFLLSSELPTAPRPIDWAIGAAYLVRRRALREVGGMNEWFFLYGEDVDWCYRMWQKGWEVHVVPHAVMEHRFTRLSSRSLNFRSAATRHHWASLAKLFILHPTLLVGRGPRAARERINRWATQRSAATSGPGPPR